MSSSIILRRQKETKELLDFPEDKIPQEALLVLIKSTREMITYLYNKHGSKRCDYPTCRKHCLCWLADKWNRTRLKSGAAEGNGP